MLGGISIELFIGKLNFNTPTARYTHWTLVSDVEFAPLKNSCEAIKGPAITISFSFALLYKG